MKSYVLDANVLYGYLAGESKKKRVGELFKKASRADRPVFMSVVNWGEVAYLIWRAKGESTARRLLADADKLPLQIEPVLREDALAAAQLKVVHNLPYADSFAAALALREHAILVTADPHFERVGKRLQILWLN